MKIMFATGGGGGGGSLPQGLDTTDTPAFAGVVINMADQARSIHLRPSNYGTQYGGGAYGTAAGLHFGARTSTINDAYNPPGGRPLRNYQFGGYNVANNNNETPQFSGEPFFSTYLEDWWWRPSGTTGTASSVSNEANSVVVMPTDYFVKGDVGRWLQFTTSKNNYRILSVTNSTTATIDGNANAEANYNVELFDVWTEYHLCLGDANGVSKRVINIAYDTFGNFSGSNEMSLLADTFSVMDWYASRPSMLSIRSGAWYDRRNATTGSIGELVTRGINFFSQYPGGSSYRWFNHYAATGWQLGDPNVSLVIYGNPLTIGNTSFGATTVAGSTLTLGNASFPTTLTGSTITIPNGKIARAALAQETGVYRIRPDELRLGTGAPMSISVVASTHRLVLSGYGSSGGVIIMGNAANNNTRTDTSLFYFRLPPEYVAGGTVTVRICQTYYEQGGNAPETKTLTIDAREISPGGSAVGGNLYAGGDQTLTDTGTDYDLTISPTDLAPGDMIQIYFRTAISESGAGGDNTVVIGGIEMRINVKG